MIARFMFFYKPGVTESAVKIAKNPVQHSRTKHIDIRHHFLRDHEAKGDISLQGEIRGAIGGYLHKTIRREYFCKAKE